MTPTDPTTYTPDDEEVFSAYADAQFGIPSAELQARWDRWLAARDARVRAEAVRDAADDVNARVNSPSLITLADRYSGYYSGIRAAMQDEESRLRARAASIEQETQP